MRDVGLLIVGAALVMVPSFVGRIASGRLRLPISIAALISLVLFVVGVFVLVKVLKD
jgi:ABC-type Mn2+/Zn2+ transport system permease subunit